jgi:hypothetical protein
MSINNYIEFVNESFDSKKLSGVFSYIERKKDTFIRHLKSVCIDNDILLSNVTDDFFQYMSYVEFESELKKGELFNFPFVSFGFKLDGEYVDYETFSTLKHNLDYYSGLKKCDFFLVFSLGGSEHKGLNDLVKKRVYYKEINKQEDIFDKLGKIDTQDVERIAKQLKRLFGGEYPLFYINSKRSLFGTGDLFSLENLNRDGLLRSIHKFNIKLIEKLSKNRKDVYVIMLLEINNHIKQKLEKFFIESSDDIYGYVNYLQTILQVCNDYDISNFINYGVMDDTRNIETALKIIKKI